MLQELPMGCVSTLYSETPLALAGLLAALETLVETSLETTQRNQTLQVQTHVRKPR